MNVPNRILMKLANTLLDSNGRYYCHHCLFSIKIVTKQYKYLHQIEIEYFVYIILFLQKSNTMLYFRPFSQILIFIRI